VCTYRRCFWVFCLTLGELLRDLGCPCPIRPPRANAGHRTGLIQSNQSARPIQKGTSPSFSREFGRMNGPNEPDLSQRFVTASVCCVLPLTHPTQSVGLYPTTRAPREVSFSCGSLPPPRLRRSLFTIVSDCGHSAWPSVSRLFKRSIVTSMAARSLEAWALTLQKRPRAMHPPASPIATDSQRLPPLPALPALAIISVASRPVKEIIPWPLLCATVPNHSSCALNRVYRAVSWLTFLPLHLCHCRPIFHRRPHHEFPRDAEQPEQAAASGYDEADDERLRGPHPRRELHA